MKCDIFCETIYTLSAVEMQDFDLCVLYLLRVGGLRVE